MSRSILDLQNLKKTVASKVEKTLIDFFTPTELRDYKPPEGIILVGDSHITREAVFVIGGAPGIGKSRAAVALAQAGATGRDWFGLKVHHTFKTLIIQNENGRYRLSKEFSDLDCENLDGWMKICPPPPYGLAFDRMEFRDALEQEIETFKPDVVIIDPWNAVARDDKARDYLETFDLIRSIIPAGDGAPALGIVAHTRKPKSDERVSGRGLLNLLAGSYVLASIPRTVFVMQAASDEPSDDRIVWTCCKNNDGQAGSPTAWIRKNGLFEPVEDFDWNGFDRPEQSRKAVTEAHLKQLFDSDDRLSKKDAVAKLMDLTGCGQSACYAALNPDGKFKDNLRLDTEKFLNWQT